MSRKRIGDAGGNIPVLGERELLFVSLSLFFFFVVQHTFIKNLIANSWSPIKSLAYDRYSETTSFYILLLF